jgi:hypothetical protein
MASSETEQLAGSSSCDVCNAESGVLKRSTVLRVLARQKSGLELFSTQAGLFQSDPSKFKRERWEIVAGKITLCDDLRGQILSLPDESKNLMGEKPLFLVDPRQLLEGSCEAALNVQAHLLTHDPSDSCDRAWHRCQRIVENSKTLLSLILGNAEEQPKPREESGPVIGNPPVTPAPANPSGSLPFYCGRQVDSTWLASLELDELTTLSDACLAELDRRGVVLHWSLTGA